MHSYPRHIGDYQSHTGHLSMMERGAYDSLLDLYYLHEKPLRGDAAAVARLVRARGAKEVDAVERVLLEFFDSRGGAWHNKRADEEIAKARDKREKAQASALRRWSDGNANASQNGCEGNAPHVPCPSGPYQRDSERARGDQRDRGPESLFDALARTSLRSEARNRRASLAKLAERLAADGMTVDHLDRLAAKARTKGHDHGKLLGHMLRGDWRAELGEATDPLAARVAAVAAKGAR